MTVENRDSFGPTTDPGVYTRSARRFTSRDKVHAYTSSDVAYTYCGIDHGRVLMTQRIDLVTCKTCLRQRAAGRVPR